MITVNRKPAQRDGDFLQKGQQADPMECSVLGANQRNNPADGQEGDTWVTVRHPQIAHPFIMDGGRFSWVERDGKWVLNNENPIIRVDDGRATIV